MTPRMNVGKGVSGAVRYVFGPGRDPETGELKQETAGDKSRVDWISGQNFGFEVKSRADAELARRIMEFDALNQKSRTRQCEQDCVHIALGWRPGDKPTREQMEKAAHKALEAIGMGNARALFVAHNDEDYKHLHIIASKINPETGRAYDLKGSWRTLSDWALAYEREHGGVICTRREAASELRNAIRDRDADGVLNAMTKQRATFTARQLENALAKEIRDPAARAGFTSQIIAHVQTVGLADRPGGEIAHYTTRTALEAEQYVLRSAAGLALDSRHHIGDRAKAAVLNSKRFEGISREQARASRPAPFGMQPAWEVLRSSTDNRAPAKVSPLPRSAKPTRRPATARSALPIPTLWRRTCAAPDSGTRRPFTANSSGSTTTAPAGTAKPPSSSTKPR